jgi:hypothetical protein
MATKRRLVLFVEGEGDVEAVPPLVKRLLTDHGLWEPLFLDPDPIQVDSLQLLLRDQAKNWRRLLEVGVKRGRLGGVLLLLDGDIRPVKGKVFCATEAARELSRQARAVGGGSLFSVASVFALREYESWLIACAEAVAGRAMSNGQPGVRSGAIPPPGNLELAPRDAKGWLDGCMEGGYKAGRDQGPLTELVVHHLDTLRQREMKSFRRLEKALQELATATQTGNHVATPAPPSS